MFSLKMKNIFKCKKENCVIYIYAPSMRFHVTRPPGSFVSNRGLTVSLSSG